MCASLTKDSTKPESRNVVSYRSDDGRQPPTEYGTSSSPSGKNQTEIANPNDSVVKANYFVSASVVKQVTIVVVYESLCPYSTDFVYAQLLPTYSKLSPYIMLTMLPFGKALVRNETDGKGHNVTTISCHHGPSECTGNQIETCVLRVVKTTLIAVQIVACMSQHPSPHLAGQGCVEANGVQWSLIEACVKQHGDEYELQVARATWSYQIVVTRVPLVIIDGDKGNYVNGEAQKDMMGLTCNRIVADGNMEPKPCVLERRRRRRRRR
ncbi:gamma-interferon inducible lysosomal thiol reductase, putative [Ixodes scapularis]|uniref:Gamma-interferon inducible lysosomal thiol reductase, putative n=1 Tax=Ixodes scapularis TaxID=6945 RepID=B7Q845_IXOSC|nr:gamma-interferon inducible lysosomal thiol reductase, putative [Ixodes scapularis]|eukprot:XP_002412282.1 gamma-interferon inducible lysosomal thiol reductase, putative [Ixodes scapularis]